MGEGRKKYSIFMYAKLAVNSAKMSKFISGW
jgi:hypothetical protein